MTLKEGLTQYAHDVALSPTGAKVVTAATAAAGINSASGWMEAFGWLERSVGVAAALMGLLVTVAIWRKIRLETRLERHETELRIKVLERQLEARDSGAGG